MLSHRAKQKRQDKREERTLLIGENARLRAILQCHGEKPPSADLARIRWEERAPIEVLRATNAALKEQLRPIMDEEKETRERVRSKSHSMKIVARLTP